MVVGDSVVAAVKPADEESAIVKQTGIFDDFKSEQEEEAEEDCICICFCDDDDEEDEEENSIIKLESETLVKNEPAKQAKEEEKIENTTGEEEEEGLIDPHEEVREQCSQKKECASLLDKLNECNARVESRSKTAETCVEELIDFMHCVDHCAAKSLFSMLK